ncbi:MAG: diguanylate cyclase domain-containing protein [Microcoleaceae cyanobacterium]
MSDALANILVIEDQPENFQALSMLLTQQSYQIQQARTGGIALEIARLNPPDLILLDIQMLDMTGYDICQQLKAKAELQAIPVIFVSTSSSAFDQVKAFQVGGSDYIKIPFEPKEVIARIRHQLAIHQRYRKLLRQNRDLRRQVQERQQAEEETQLMLKMVQAVGEAWDFDTALQLTLQEVCQTLGWDYGEAWIPQDNSQMMLQVSQIAQETEALEKFSNQNLGLTFAPNAGLVGRVWFSRQIEWIKDLTQSSSISFEQTQNALNAGLRSVIAVPILQVSQVLAVLMFYKHELLAPSDRLIQLLSAVSVQLGSLMQHKKAEQALQNAYLELERLAKIDSLTQIANRRYFDECLRKEWSRLAREQQPLSLIFCEVDCFQAYNEHYGHQTGDQCLKRIAKVVDRSVRRPADLVARYAGAVFAILLPNTHIEGAMQLAEWIRTGVSDLRIAHEQSTVNPYMTLSLGLSSVVPHRDLSFMTLVRIADEALYQAKDQGHNRAITKFID